MVRLISALLLAASVCRADEALDIVRRSVAVDQRNDLIARNYAFTTNRVNRSFDGKGNLKSTDSQTTEIVFVHGRQVEKTVAVNGKPLDAEDAAEEQRRIDKLTAEYARESEAERRRREGKEDRQREELRGLRSDIPIAYTFRLLGEEPVNGRPAWIIEATPRPDYKPRSKRAEILKKMAGRLWIDKTDYSWSKIDAELTDGVSFGWFVARLSKGARFRFEQRRVNDELWIPTFFRIRFDARVGMLVPLRREIEQTLTDVRRFQTESRVTDVFDPGESPLGAVKP